MKLIDQTPFLAEKGKITLFDRLRGTLRYGFSWYPELQAQQVIIAHLQKHLGDNFTLLRNFPLGETGVHVPMILIGPPGIYMLYATHWRGVYRVKGDEMGTISGNTFKPVSINLVRRTARLARALEVYLRRQLSEDIADVHAVLLAADPGMHVESTRPEVRIVMRDALEHFATSLLQERPIYNAEAVRRLVDRLMETIRPPEAELEVPEDDEFFVEEKPKKRPAPRPAIAPTVRPPRRVPAALRGFAGLSARQWAVLLILGAIEICVLIGMILVVLLNT
ncbi:MAG: hypothetical protein D6770_10415 [Anaerolineae bacterium]|nr:MAG: hypothetical protein D6770_10415 [Anaerolineae bacterium]